MDDLFPALILIFGAITSIISAAKKEKEKKAAMENHKAATAARLEAARKKQAAAAKPAPLQPSMPQAAPPAAPMSPTVHPHVEPDCETHDQPGSLGVTSMEGKDPCHKDELTLERSVSEAPAQESGLTFDWSGQNMVKAFILQEVLNRPMNRAPVCKRQAH